MIRTSRRTHDQQKMTDKPSVGNGVDGISTNEPHRFDPVGAERLQATGEHSFPTIGKTVQDVTAAPLSVDPPPLRAEQSLRGGPHLAKGYGENLFWEELPLVIPKRGYFPAQPPLAHEQTLVDQPLTDPPSGRNHQGEELSSSPEKEATLPRSGISPQREESSASAQRKAPSQQELLEQFATSRRKKKDRLFYALMIVFLIGMLYGSIFSVGGGQGSSALLPSLSATHEASLRQMQSASLLDGFGYSLRASSLFLLLLFLTGTCMIGQPVSLVILFVRGLGVGSYMGYLYATYAGAGVVYSTLLILPGMLVATVALVLAGREAILFSNLTLSLHCKSPRMNASKGQSTGAGHVNSNGCYRSISKNLWYYS